MLLMGILLTLLVHLAVSKEELSQQVLSSNLATVTNSHSSSSHLAVAVYMIIV